jgi:xylulokinase
MGKVKTGSNTNYKEVRMAVYIMAVDIGTQGTKAVLFDREMTARGTAFESSRLVQPEIGTFWQEAGDIYGSVVRVIKQLLEETGVKGNEIAALGIDSQMAGIMGIDRDGEAATYYDSWLDTRCKKYVTLMRERSGRRIIELTGGPVTYTHGPKILWWKNEEPSSYRKTAKYVLPHAYVVGKLCGLSAEESYFDWTHLHYSGFADNLRKEWSEELLSAFDIPREKMARIVSPFEVVGKINSTAAALTGLTAGVPVVAGAGDTAASIFGAGLFGQDEVLDCAGTASVFCCGVDSFSPDVSHKTMTMMRSPEDGRWFPLAYINGGGLCVRWFRDSFTGVPPLSYAGLEEEAGRLPAGSEGLIFVPHFAGRVLPSNPALKGSFTGLDFKHSRAHLFRAVMEGIAYEYAFYLSVLRDLYPGSDFRRMTAIGGGSKSDLFVAIKADVLGLSAVRSVVGDTALVGSAVIAAYGTGVISDYRAAIRKTIREEPPIRFNEERHEQYQPLTQRYLKVLDALSVIGAA